MALGDERRASGRRMEQARRQSGAQMETQRRALDAAMVARRRGESVVEDMQRLESPPRTQRALPPVTPRGGIPAARGRAYYQDKPKTGGGGIASPLSEPDFAAREYWPGGLKSSDGILILPAERRIVMRDALNAEVIFEYAEPA